MPWRAFINGNPAVITTVYEGSLSPEELGAAVQETIRLVRQLVPGDTGTAPLLGDCSGLQGGHSVFNLYGLMDVLEKAGVAHRIKEAVLLPELPGPAEDVRFWETMCLNRGVRIRIFTDRAQAMAWLAEP